MFKIYHSKKCELNSQLHFLNCEFYFAHKNLYDHVANVDCNSVGQTFQLTNHIDFSWWENEGVTLIKESRSTSVGDVVEDMKTNKLWLCCSVGWQQISWTDKLTDVLNFFKEEMRIFFKDCKLEEVKDRIDEICQQIESIFALSVKENEAEAEEDEKEDKFYSDLFNHWDVDINDANKKMCTGCRKMYVPIMKEDDDCCPSCARF